MCGPISGRVTDLTENGESLMKKLFRGIVLAFLLPLCLNAAGRSSASAAATNPKDTLLATMQQELQRAKTELGKLDPAPYFMSYAVHDQSTVLVVGSQGGMINSTQARARTADVIVRVGTPALDNTHGENRPSGISSGSIPLTDDAAAISHCLWQLTYGEYRKASQTFSKVKTSTEVNAKEEDTSPDFSQETSEGHADYSEPAPAQDQLALEGMVRRYSAWFAKYPYVYRSTVMVTIERVRWHFVSTEGTHLVAPSATYRLVIEAESQADDGMELMRIETFQASGPGRLPGDAEIAPRVEKMAADLKALRSAPLAEPYDGARAAFRPGRGSVLP